MFFSVFITIVGIRSDVVYADTSNFTVNPRVSRNQIGEDQGYFNLLMKPGEVQEVSFDLSNTTSKSVIIDMGFARSTTNDNGLAVYEPISNQPDSSLQFNIEDYVKLSKTSITLAAHSQTVVTAKVSMPNMSFNGVISGGFSFKERNENEAKVDSQSGVAVINEYRYIVALVIQQNQNSIKPDLHLNNVFPAQVNSRNVIQANLQNAAATYLQDMNVSATIHGLSNPDLKYSYANSNMKMAPNSNFDFAIPISVQGNLEGNQTSPALQSGKYHLSMTVYGQRDVNGSYQTMVNNRIVKYKYRWVFERNFEITDSKAESLNRTDPTVHYKEPFNWLMLIGIFLIIVCIFFFLIWKRRKKEEVNEKEKKEG